MSNRELIERGREYAEMFRGIGRGDAAQLITAMADALSALEGEGATPVGGLPFEFDRYIDGTLMAEGVRIEKEATLERAVAAALRMAYVPRHSTLALVLRSAPALPPSGMSR